MFRRKPFLLFQRLRFSKNGSYEFSEDPSGTVRIAAETGVYRFAGGQVESVTKGTALSVVAATPGIAVAAVAPLGNNRPENTSLVRMERTGSSWRTDTVMSLGSEGPLTLDPAGRLLYPILGRGWNVIPLAEVVAWHQGLKITPATMPSKVNQGRPFPQNGKVKVIGDHLGCIWERNEVDASIHCGDGLRKITFGVAEIDRNIRETSDGTMILSGNSVLAVGRSRLFPCRDTCERITRHDGCDQSRRWHNLDWNDAGLVPVCFPVSH